MSIKVPVYVAVFWWMILCFVIIGARRDLREVHHKVEQRPPIATCPVANTLRRSVVPWYKTFYVAFL